MCGVPIKESLSLYTSGNGRCNNAFVITLSLHNPLIPTEKFYPCPWRKKSLLHTCFIITNSIFHYIFSFLHLTIVWLILIRGVHGSGLGEKKNPNQSSIVESGFWLFIPPTQTLLGWIGSGIRVGSQLLLFFLWKIYWNTIFCDILKHLNCVFEIWI